MPSENITYLNSALNDFAPEIIINCMASWGVNSSPESQLDSNLLTPLGVLLNIPQETKLWVQCNSYFNKYYEKFGSDKDQYSRLRRVFTEQATYLAAANRSIAIHEVMLPHLVGAGQRSTNLVPSAFTAFRSNSKLSVGSGNQVIPILSVQDAAFEIISKTGMLAEGTFKQSDVNPVVEITVRKLLERIQTAVSSDVNVDFDSSRDREKEFYEGIYGTVGFGEANKNYKSLEEILGEF